MNEDEFLGKVEWEGGVLDALEYGLKAEHLKDQNRTLFIQWRLLEKAWKSFQPTLGAVEQYFEDWQEDNNAEGKDYAG